MRKKAIIISIKNYQLSKKEKSLLKDEKPWGLILFKRNIKLKDIKKNDIIYWKGHVAVALSKKKLIHAYGPMKKTVIMSITHTIKKIQKTANLKVIGIKRI